MVFLSMFLHTMFLHTCLFAFVAARIAVAASITSNVACGIRIIRGISSGSGRADRRGNVAIDFVGGHAIAGTDRGLS
jgi:hypothetical protein